MRGRPLVAPLVASAVLIAGASGFLLYEFGQPIWVPAYHRLMGKRTVGDVLDDYGVGARAIWSARLRSTGINYPPREITLLAFKRERVLEVWTSAEGPPVKIAEYPILAASGTLGPKLQEGDNQVPEGLYSIEGLNPNSAYHLSMKLDYPNAFDRARAADEGRTRPGSDIFIHGKRASIGCLAMGDPAIEELFVLVAETGPENTRVLIAPCDFRAGCAAPESELPWVAGLCDQLREQLTRYTRGPR